MNKKLPINLSVLKWARETAGIDINDVALKMKKNADVIKAWENGDTSPTYIQLETLAYDIYKRPIAIFFFPEPPDETSLKQSFRTLPEYEISQIPPHLRQLIRKAKAMQVNLAELNNNINPAKQRIVYDLRFESSITIDELTEKVRNYLNIPLTVQFDWEDNDEAFKTWRKIIENFGVFVFKEAFKDDNFSGFCIFDEVFPVIYINNSKSKTRQIFTLFHELAHLLFGTGGIDIRAKNYINMLTGNEKKIETICNSFAGEFLVPTYDFKNKSNKIKINDTSILSLARLYHVSREVILRKLFNLNKITQSYYEKKVKQWGKKAKDKKKRNSGGNYYATQNVYLSPNYLELSFSKYYQNIISIEQLSNYLNIKIKNITNLETRFLTERGAM
jgi:Zn-dependent peptidase ImmA (M78 family)